MKIETKSLLIGVVSGILGFCAILYIFGDVETEFSFVIGEDKKRMKSIPILM